MKAIPIEQYLKRSEHIQSARPAAARQNPLFPRAIVKAPPPDIEALTQASYERGRQDGLIAARAEHAGAAARDAADAERRTADERTAFQACEYAELAGHITHGLEQIEIEIAAAIARILGPVLIREKSVQITDVLSLALKNFLSSDCPPLLTISGPEPELAILRDKLASSPVAFEMKPDGARDITVQAQSTLIKTQLGAWVSLIDGICS